MGAGASLSEPSASGNNDNDDTISLNGKKIAAQLPSNTEEGTRVITQLSNLHGTLCDNGEWSEKEREQVYALLEKSKTLLVRTNVKYVQVFVFIK